MPMSIPLKTILGKSFLKRSEILRKIFKLSRNRVLHTSRYQNNNGAERIDSQRRNHCTAINKEKIILSLTLFLLLDYGYVSKTTLIFSAPSQIIVASIDSASTTLALHIIVAMFGFDFITADIAANGVFGNQYESSFVKSSCIRCAP